MNEEIKEILDFITTLVKENKESDMPLKTCVMPFETLYKLLDYITNLQKENERLKGEYHTFEAPSKLVEAINMGTIYKSRIEKANILLQNILVVSDWEHKGKFRPVKNTSAQDVYKTIIMLNELFETPYRTNYGLLQGVNKDE